MKSKRWNHTAEVEGRSRAFSHAGRLRGSRAASLSQLAVWLVVLPLLVLVLVLQLGRMSAGRMGLSYAKGAVAAWTPGDLDEVEGLTVAAHWDRDVGVTITEDKVSQWDTVSGTIANAAQSNASLRPTSESDGIYANGAGIVLDMSASFDTAGGATILVCGYKDADGNECALLGGAGNANINVSASGALAADLVVHDGSSFGTIADASHTTALTISLIEIGVATTTWWKDGSQIGTMSSKFPVLTKLLNRGSAMTAGWRESDVVLISGTLTTDQKNQLCNYVADKRGTPAWALS